MKDKRFLLRTSALTLLPVLVGLILWNWLPEEIPTHWGLGGGPDGWSSRGFAVFGLPVMMLGFQWIMVGATYLDRENVRQNEKLMKVILMIFPVLSNVMMFLLYSVAMGLDLNMTRVLLPLLGLSFLAIGNYLPKCRQNSTVGIKLKWTLYNEENWNKTHRFGGMVFCLGGLAFVIAGLLPMAIGMWLMPVLMVVLIAAPTLYSYLLYKKQVEKGTWVQSERSKAVQKRMQRLTWISLAAVALILIVVAALMFTGEVTPTLDDEALTIEASFWQDARVPYADIDAVEYRPEGVDGTREWGYGSAKLLLGLFRNEEFGNYTRYTYTGDGDCIVIRSGENVLVLAAENDEATRTLYEELLEKIG